MKSISSKLINPALMVNYFVRLFFLPIELMMKEQAALNVVTVFLAFTFSTKDFYF